MFPRNPLTTSKALVVALVSLGAVAVGPPPAAAAAGDVFAAGTRFCATTHPNHGTLEGYGPALDLGSHDDAGWPVYAPGDGRVRIHSEGWGGGWGNSIIWIAQGGGERIHMAHLASFGATGRVRAGDLIGRVGSTGRSTSPHLHASAQRDGKPAKLVLGGRVLKPDTCYTSIGPIPPTCMGLPATIVGTPGPDLLVGTSGNDVIVGLGGADRIKGRGGDDMICGGPGRDILRGGPGADVLIGGRDADLLVGGLGPDDLRGGTGPDTLNGGQDDDVLRGGGGADTLTGGPGDDLLMGLAGDDTLDGGDGLDEADGGDDFDSCVAEVQVNCEVDPTAVPEPDPDPEPSPDPDPEPEPAREPDPEPSPDPDPEP